MAGEHAEWLRARVSAGPFTTRRLRTDPRAVWVFLHAEGQRFEKTVLSAAQSRRDIAFGRGSAPPTAARRD
jgi:hypothetical protein